MGWDDPIEMTWGNSVWIPLIWTVALGLAFVLWPSMKRAWSWARFRGKHCHRRPFGCASHQKPVHMVHFVDYCHCSCWSCFRARQRSSESSAAWIRRGR